MKKFVSVLVKKVFLLRPLENLLLKIIRRFGTNNLLIHCIPLNTMYEEFSPRFTVVDNLKYNLNVSSFNNWAIYWCITSERAPKNFFYNQITEDSVVIDLGAHIGEITMNVANRASKGKVYAIEAFPPTFLRLQKHLELNEVKNVVAINVAIGDKEGYVNFEVNDSNQGANRISEFAGDEFAGSVVIKTLDEVLADRNIDRIDLIKIDIEGYEILALKGASKTVSVFKPAVFIEFSDETLRNQGGSAFTLYREMQKMGFSKFFDVRDKKMLSDSSNFDGMHSDILASF